MNLQDVIEAYLAKAYINGSNTVNYVNLLYLVVKASPTMMFTYPPTVPLLEGQSRFLVQNLPVSRFSSLYPFLITVLLGTHIVFVTRPDHFQLFFIKFVIMPHFSFRSNVSLSRNFVSLLDQAGW